MNEKCCIIGKKHTQGDKKRLFIILSVPLNEKSEREVREVLS